MPYVLMPNQTRVFVHNDTFSSHQQEITYEYLLSELNSQSSVNGIRCNIRAARVIGALGALAIDAVPKLEYITYSSVDIPFVQECRNALEKISSTSFRRVESQRGATGDNTNASKDAIGSEKKKKMNEIQIVQENGSLNAKMSRKCNFCEKETVSEPECQRLCDLLCRPNKFYCNFCLRHNFHMKDNKHVLMMTFRAIFGYYYYEFYQTPKSPQMYLSEIQDYIDLHRDTGLNNPVFCYDPDSYLWFVDFRRVGKNKKKITVEDVKKTIIDILASFNLATNIVGIDMNKLYQKYNEAIDDFYTKRYRPENKRLLAPTLKNCGNIQWGGININTQWQTQQQSQKITLEDTKNFMPSLIVPEKYWRKTASI